MKKPNNKPKFTNTRKVLRKQKRQEKKVKRKEHYLKKNIDSNELHRSTSPGKFVKIRPETSEPDNVVKKNKKPKNPPTVQELLKLEQEKEKRATDKLKSMMNEQRRKMLLEANDAEDKIIKKLEKQLGLNKTRNKNNFFADDGLDYLLEVCDRTTSEQIVAAEKHLAEVERDSDFEDDLAAVTGKEPQRKKEKGIEITEDGHDSVDDMDEDDELGSDDDMLGEDSEMSEDGTDFKDNGESDDDGETGDDGEDDSEVDGDEEPERKKRSNNKNNNKTKEKIIAEEDLSKIFSDDEVSHLSDDEELSGGEENSEIEPKEKPDVWEDIYGRKRDKEGNIIKEEKGIYIPPHLRNKDSTSEKEMAQLKRQVKSVLNKLAGTNLHWACTSIENLYTSNSRHSMNTVLTSLYMEGVVGRSMTPERMLAEHAAMIAVLHANVGSEIGAHFLEELCKRFDAMMDTSQPVEDKTLDNLVACLAHLFCFKLYQSTLLFDILSRLTHTLSEKCIDVLLVCVRCAGAALRKEAPLELKTFIHDTQARSTKIGAGVTDGSRIKFLLEVLLAIKNNNLNKIPNYDPSYVEHLKKMTRSIVRKGNYITPLNIRLEDLLKAQERGKWWVVGSAWEGQAEVGDKQIDKQTTHADQRMMELARKQRMNTDVRRSIFCVIMSAEDYMDAFSKLEQLSLKGQQQREISHVLLSCSLHEKAYNPYYSVLADKLCSVDRKYQLSIQYSVWDKIKEIETLSKQSTTNLAQFLIHLFISKALPLSILKIIQFSDLNKKTVRFMRQILLAVIMNDNMQASLEVFHRIAKPPKLHMFRESLRLFIQHFLIKNAGKQSAVLSEEEMRTLKERAQEVDKILTMHETKLRF
ncbi:nucleolar MIF4G domain-containing protein 1 homolog [Danaus plexippus]|uniref:nucleolar MIF4G domain-containing protein 1 homolog n=1 Tax=Danaus plexippus TaxID=13037 RepID=UPI002AB027D1|nr:nucleolar MIF4G domain-containing protein 1 homolog [Danaus plexippus]